MLMPCLPVCTRFTVQIKSDWPSPALLEIAVRHSATRVLTPVPPSSQSARGISLAQCVLRCDANRCVRPINDMAADSYEHVARS